ncbi:MAG: ParB/RepB/Spo0J family partition protein [Clostridiales bacterium]|nr:ParB/RepB/Spo0J family partition protein [Clostridiales bacterium]
MPISKVEVGINQPREYFDEASLEELAKSISQHGIIQPLTVRKLSSGYYQIIAGERRWRAARMAGLDEIPVRIIEADDRKAMEIALIENLQREDLNPIEEAKGYKALIEEYGFTQEKAAERVGKSRPTITNAMRLLSLPDEIIKMVEEGSISSGHARALLALENDDEKLRVANMILTDGMSVRQTEHYIRKLLNSGKRKTGKKNAEESELEMYISDLENKLTTDLGRRIKIHNGVKKGRMEIEYYGNDDLETLINALQVLKKQK